MSKTIVAKNGRVLEGQQENWQKLVKIHAEEIRLADEQCRKMIAGYAEEVDREKASFDKEAVDFLFDFSRVYTNDIITLEDYESNITLAKCVEECMKSDTK